MAPTRSADALVEVCAFFNANHTRPGTPRRRPHVELIVEADTLATPLAWTTDHADVGVATTDMVLCDCVIHRVLRAGDTILNYGRATYTVPKDLFRAVAARDGGLRPQRLLVRRPPHPLLAPPRPNRPRKFGVALQPPPPPHPPPQPPSQNCSPTATSTSPSPTEPHAPANPATNPANEDPETGCAALLARNRFQTLNYMVDNWPVVLYSQ